MKTHIRRVFLIEQKRAEKIAAIIRLGVFTLMMASFLALENSFPWTALPIILLSCYALVGVIGLGLSFADIYRPWFAFVYSTLDILILFGFFAALANFYQLPLSEILRLPGASLIFLFIALSAFRYQVSLIVYTASLFTILWVVLFFKFGQETGINPKPQHDALPLQAEYLRLAITILVSLITCLLVYRTHRLLLNFIIENRRSENLSKYLPTSLVNNIAYEGSNLVKESHCQKAAVLFVDIRGFTKMSENQTPREVINFLTEFRRHMNSAIQTHGGTIDKFIGDAIMVVFGVPKPRDQDARNALLCGIDMLQSLEEWNQERALQKQKPVKVGVGIHYGEVIAGALGDENRLEYTIIGDTVNVAERLEGLTRKQNAPLIISSAVFKAALPFPQSHSFIEAPNQFLNGRKAPIDTFIQLKKNKK